MSVLDADTRHTFLDKRRKTRLASLVEATPGVHPAGAGPSFSVTRGDLIHRAFSAPGHFREIVPRIATRPDEESRCGRPAEFKWPSLPHLTRKREQIGRQGDHSWHA